MRLIDADAFDNVLKDAQTECKKNGGNFRFGVLNNVRANLAKAPTIGGWISVKGKMPMETHSIFFPLYGKQKWSSAMWKEQSDKVLVTVTFKDGTRLVTTGETHDGVWHTSISRTLEPEVTHWMPLPEPPKVGEDE